MDSKLILKLATENQIRASWEDTCQEWGQGISLQEYFERETLLRSCPFTSANLAVWVLVPEDNPDTLNLLSHLEVISRPAYVKRKQLVTAKVHTILSVFTPPAQRKKGYGTLMLEKLCGIMRLDGVGSILFSDIGKFYERFNFEAFPAFHTIISTSQLVSPLTDVELIDEEGLKAISRLDCNLIQSELEEDDIIIEPNFDTYYWHIQRSRFYAKINRHPLPETFGVKYTEDKRENAKLQFIVWANDYSQKKLVILRHRLGGKASSLLRAAQNYAHASGMQSIIGWNLDEKLLKDAGVDDKVEVVERTHDSLPYLLTFDGGRSLKWKNVQKYTWA